ncbi:MAG: CapA family protein [Bacillota bacterium]
MRRGLSGWVALLVSLATLSGCAAYEGPRAAPASGGNAAGPRVIAASPAPSPGQLPPPAPPASSESEPTATLVFVGDILLADRIGDLIRRDGPDAPWGDMGSVLAAADFAAGNLETSVGTAGTAQPGKQYTFQAAPDALRGVVNAGLDAVGLGNNHVLDYGPDGLKQTLAALDQAGIPHTGAGLDEAEAFSPVLADVRGLTVGFLSFSRVVPEGWAAGPRRPGIASAYDEASMLRVVQDTAARCDVLAVSVHWGEESRQAPPPAVEKLARRLVEAGADVVVGHHPHVWQGLTAYRGALIAYSVGNFVFTTSNPLGVQTGVLQVQVNRQGVVGGRIVPAVIDWGRTVAADPDQAEAFFQRIRALSDLPLDRAGAFRLTEPRRGLEGPLPPTAAP